MKTPRCNCSRNVGDCPTPYTCGFYHLEGRQETFDLDEQITGPWDWITAPTKTLVLIAIAFALLAALFIFKVMP
jgi:hypothetical protein